MPWVVWAAAPGQHHLKGDWVGLMSFLFWKEGVVCVTIHRASWQECI